MFEFTPSASSRTFAIPVLLNPAPGRGFDPQRYGVACRQVHEASMMFDGTVTEQVRQQADGVVGQRGVNKGFLPLESLCGAAAR